MFSWINVFSSLIMIQSAERTKLKLSLHLICTVRHLGTKLPTYLCKPFVRYHWSGIRWLIVFFRGQWVVDKWSDKWEKCLLFSPWFLRGTLVLHNGEEVGLFRSATESEWMLYVAQNDKIRLKSTVTSVNKLCSAACQRCLRNVSLPVNNGPRLFERYGCAAENENNTSHDYFMR